MNPGLPGVGIGGFFYLASALLMPFVEAVRTIRGRSSLARWRAVAHQVGQAVLMVGAVGAALILLQIVLGHPNTPPGAPASTASGGEAVAPSGTAVPAFLLAGLALGVVLMGAMLLRLWVRSRSRRARSCDQPVS